MLIHNTTFMIEPGREEEFLQWFAAQLPELTCGCDPIDKGARLSALRMVAGQTPGEDEAHSVAFQMEFADMDALVKWADGPLQTTAGRFMLRFGPNAMFFTSVFQTIPLPPCP